MKTTASMTGLTVAALLTVGGTSAEAQTPYRITWDDFHSGISISSPSAPDANAKWFYFNAGPAFVGNDGITSTGPQGLRVVSSGTNPTTHEPAFTLTVGQEGSADNPLGLPGGLDHVKWLVYTNHTASSGYPGFDLVAGQEFACEAWVGGQSFGTANQPFGSTVTDPADDIRLASSAMNTIDFESFAVADFFLSNKAVYVLYERLPYGRGVQGNPADYAAYTFVQKVADRQPGDIHHVAIAFNRSAGTIRWLLEGQEVLSWNHIGHRMTRGLMTLDHGGTEYDVSPRQIACGIGSFSLLDAYRPSEIGLAQLSNQPYFYFDPSVGSPVPESFIDPMGLHQSRLFGQGAELDVRRLVVRSGGRL
jgi:hypothetical protein